MRIEELYAELERDLPIKLTHLQSEAVDNPKLHGKWNRYLSEIAKERVRIESELKIAHKTAFMNVSGRGDEVSEFVFSTTEYKHLLPADEEVLKYTKALDVIDIKLNFCKTALDGIKQRGFAIRAAIDIRKMENGD